MRTFAKGDPDGVGCLTGEGETEMKYSNAELCAMVDEFCAFDAEP